MDLKGGLTLNHQGYRIDDEDADEIFINIQFHDDGALTSDDKFKIGVAVEKCLAEIMEVRWAKNAGTAANARKTRRSPK